MRGGSWSGVRSMRRSGRQRAKWSRASANSVPLEFSCPTKLGPRRLPPIAIHELLRRGLSWSLPTCGFPQHIRCGRGPNLSKLISINCFFGAKRKGEALKKLGSKPLSYPRNGPRGALTTALRGSIWRGQYSRAPKSLAMSNFPGATPRDADPLIGRIRMSGRPKLSCKCTGSHELALRNLLKGDLERALLSHLRPPPRRLSSSRLRLEGGRSLLL